MNSYERLEILQALSTTMYISSRKLAEGLSIGEKTLRGRISELNKELTQEVAEIIMKRGAGYLLQVNNDVAFLEWKEELLASEKQEIPSIAKDRVDYILLYLLNHHDYVKREEICDFLYISEKTVSQDMRQVEYILKQYGLLLEKKAHHGIRIVGEEFPKRQCIMNYYLVSGADWFTEHKNVNENMATIQNNILSQIQRERLCFTEMSVKRLIDYIYISQHRVKYGYIIDCINGPKMNPELVAIAQRMVQNLREVGVFLSQADEEIYYMALYLQGCRMFEQEMNGTENVVITEATERLTEQMLESIYHVYQIDYRKNFNLRMNINKHLLAMELRLRFGIEITNPILSEVREKYLFSYLLAQQACIPISEKYQRKISEDEIAYFAMFFEMERIEGEDNGERVNEKKNILLVCATGKTSSRFLLLTLKKQFQDYIQEIELCSLYEFDTYDLSKFDCVFSTVTISKSIPIPIVMIHDFLSKSEFLTVKEKLYYMEHQVLDRFYRPELFFTDIEGKTKEEVLKEMCTRMNEVIELPESFLESVLYREELGSTDFGNLTAIPHPHERLSNENFVCVGVLKQPLRWSNNSVQLVILSAIAEGMSHEVRQFFDITVKLISNKDAVEKIVKEQSYASLHECLEEAMTTY